MFTLETRRLILRDWRPDDSRFIWTLASDARVTRYQTRLRIKDEEAARQWLTSAMLDNDRQPRSTYSLAITLREDGSVIGWLSWHDSEDRTGARRASVTHCSRRCGKQGYTSEAVLAMLPFVFEVQERHSVYATCATSNPGSAGVLEKAGLRLVERWMHRDDDLGLEEEYRRYLLNRDDWLAAR